MSLKPTRSLPRIGNGCLPIICTIGSGQIMNSISSRRTPINPDYPTCDECYAALFVYPGERHPDEVSQLLNMEPTRKNVAGTTIINSSGRQRKIPISGWFLSSEGKVKSKDLRDHINWLLNKIYAAKAGIKQLQGMEGLELGINCTWPSLAGHGGPTLWPEQMKIIAELELECTFDIYFEKNTY